MRCQGCTGSGCHCCGKRTAERRFAKKRGLTSGSSRSAKSSLRAAPSITSCRPTGKSLREPRRPTGRTIPTYLTLGSFGGVRLITTESAFNYKNYFTATTTPVFIFQPGILDPNEKVSITGETISWDATDTLNVSADYKAYAYDLAGNAKYVGGNVKYHTTSEGGGGGLSVHKMEGDTDRLKYSEYRVYGYKKINKTDLALDLIDMKYSAPINGVSNAYSASLAAQYDLTERLKIGADVEYSKNPDFDKDVRAFLKAIYRFDIGAGKGV